MNKPATADHPIHELIKERWSPRAFSEQLISREDINTLLEAARWAPSAYNDQPWYFIAAKRSNAEEFGRMLACLVPQNQIWAKHAAALLISVARTSFMHNGKPNPYAAYDTGQAAAAITIQSVALGIRTHQMAGFDAKKTRETYMIPDGFDPLTAIALGYSGDLTVLPENLQKAEVAPRQRRSIADFVFQGKWSSPY